jgi:signal transduction histidine kinase
MRRHVGDSGHGAIQAAPEAQGSEFLATKPSGMGLRLSVCRSIIEAWGGRLWASQDNPYGWVSHVLLPGMTPTVHREDAADVRD